MKILPLLLLCATAFARREIEPSDSLSGTHDSEKVVLDSAAGDPETEARDERAVGYAARFVADVSANASDAKEWAAAVFIAAGVVVVGAVVLYFPKLLYDYMTDRESFSLYREAALRYTYTGSSWTGGGSPLYRDTHLASGRLTWGIRRPALGMGLTVEGGYLSARLEEIATQPGRAFGVGGAFALLGPSLRFGGDRYALGVDFLNGASWVQGTGWITEGRFSFQARTGKRFLLGAYVGALFYDLRFFDGLVWRRGSFNRDLSLLMGLESGLAF